MYVVFMKSARLNGFNNCPTNESSFKPSENWIDVIFCAIIQSLDVPNGVVNASVEVVCSLGCVPGQYA